MKNIKNNNIFFQKYDKGAEKELNMKEKKKLIILSSIILGVLVVVLGVTYAVFTYDRSGTTSELVLGDIYMHYREGTKTINIDNMMPLKKYTLNTDSESVEKCVNYLYTTYGESWNDLEYDLREQSNETSDITGKFMAETPDRLYSEYCSGNIILPRPIHSKENNLIGQFMNVKQIDASGNTDLLTDIENGVLTETDINYFVENGILTDNVNSLKYFEFRIDGKNTDTNGSISYNIEIAKGDIPENKTEVNRIQDKFLKFRLVEVVNNEDVILVDDMAYETINNSALYTNIIPNETKTEIIHTYKVYMWIDDSILIGNTSDADYNVETWNNLFASIKVNVNGKYLNAVNLTEKIKSKLGTEGLVAVNTDGNLYNGTGEIREYRYSGLGNYCTYSDGENDYNLNVEGETCPQNVCLMETWITNGDSDAFTMYEPCAAMGGTSIGLKVEGSTPTDSGLRNYIEFNGELWRIIGVFGDNVKIVKDTPLANDVYKEITYTFGNTTYNLKYPIEGTKYGYFKYKQLNDDSYNNDWTTSGVMHYLNDTTGNSYYTKHLSDTAKNMIQETTYYLGNVNPNTLTPSGMYNDERGSVVCDSTITSSSHNSSCNIWSGNQATWTGDVALIYPSDYMYATPTTGWNLTHDEEYALYTTMRESWLSNTEAVGYWLLSPSSSRSVSVWYWDGISIISTNYSIYYFGLRPSLNLKSNVMVVSGDGSYEKPYKLLES